MTDESIKLVKSVSPIQAIEYYTGQRSHRGKYLCPFHADKHPSLTAKGGHWQCWSCGEHGDVISFVQKYFRIGFTEAVHKLAEDFGVVLPEEKPPDNALEKLYAIIQADVRDHNRNEIQRLRAGIDEEIDKLTICHRVLAQRGASESILRRYAEEIDSLIEYRQTI